MIDDTGLIAAALIGGASYVLGKLWAIELRHTHDQEDGTFKQLGSFMDRMEDISRTEHDLPPKVRFQE